MTHPPEVTVTTTLTEHLVDAIKHQSTKLDIEPAMLVELLLRFGINALENEVITLYHETMH